MNWIECGSCGTAAAECDESCCQARKAEDGRFWNWRDQEGNVSGGGQDDRAFEGTYAIGAGDLPYNVVPGLDTEEVEGELGFSDIRVISTSPCGADLLDTTTERALECEALDASRQEGIRLVDSRQGGEGYRLLGVEVVLELIVLGENSRGTGGHRAIAGKGEVSAHRVLHAHGANVFPRGGVIDGAMWIAILKDSAGIGSSPDTGKTGVNGGVAGPTHTEGAGKGAVEIGDVELVGGTVDSGDRATERGGVTEIGIDGVSAAFFLEIKHQVSRSKERVHRSGRNDCQKG